MNPKYQELRKRINKHCPYLMELRFGCELKNKDNIGRWRDDYKEGFRRTGGELYADVWDNFYGLSLWPIDEIEILGIPPTLQDVLKAMQLTGHSWESVQVVGDKVKFAIPNNEVTHFEDENGPGENYNWSEAEYDLTKPLSEQSEETVDFLLSVIE